jgi:ribosomal protein S18 acetylase RimI-like enzyme
LYRHHREIFSDAFARQLRAENIMLVADLAGFPVGQAWIDLTKREYESIGCIWAVRVFPILRNLGIGTQLMSCAENQLARRGYAVAEVGVQRDNLNARRLYERLGYQVVRQITEEYRYTTPDGVEAHHVVDQWLLRKNVERLSHTRAD